MHHSSLPFSSDLSLLEVQTFFPLVVFFPSDVFSFLAKVTPICLCDFIVIYLFFTPHSYFVLLSIQLRSQIAWTVTCPFLELDPFPQLFSIQGHGNLSDLWHTAPLWGCQSHRESVLVDWRNKAKKKVGGVGGAQKCARNYASGLSFLHSLKTDIKWREEWRKICSMLAF